MARFKRMKNSLWNSKSSSEESSEIATFVSSICSNLDRQRTDDPFVFLMPGRIGRTNDLSEVSLIMNNIDSAVRVEYNC